MSSVNFGDLFIELDDARNDSLKVLESIEAIHTELQGSQTQSREILADEYRKISIPMIYSSWESQFTSAIAICFRGLKDIDKSACEHDTSIRAVWLQQASFFSSYIDMIKNIYDIDAHKSLAEKMSSMRRKVRKGHYRLTADVLNKIDVFNATKLDSDVNVDDLVMTFSNVNKLVTEMNMEIIGLDHTNLDLSRLDNLVGLRNAFGHGQFTSRVGVREFNSWLNYTRTLIDELFREVQTWLNNLQMEILESKKNIWADKTYPTVSELSTFEYKQS